MFNIQIVRYLEHCYKQKMQERRNHRYLHLVFILLLLVLKLRGQFYINQS